VNDNVQLPAGLPGDVYHPMTPPDGTPLPKD
jgi:hypothetical protein